MEGQKGKTEALIMIFFPSLEEWCSHRCLGASPLGGGGTLGGIWMKKKLHKLKQEGDNEMSLG